MKAAVTGFLAVAAATALFQASPAGAVVNFSTGGQYDSFTSDRGQEEGDQFFTPFGLSVDSKWGLQGGLSSGYVVSSYRPPGEGAEKVTVSTFIDTNAYLGWTTSIGRSCLRLGANFNLPTGKNSLTAEERLAEMDNRYGDLVEVTDFGQGTNANPGFAFTLPLGSLTLGFGVGHTIRGAYEPYADQPGLEVDPGDETATKFSVQWEEGIFSMKAGVLYQAIWPDKVDGVEVFKEGDMLSTNLNLEFKPKPWAFFLEGSWNTWFKGKRFTGDELLAVDELKRFGDDLHVKATAEVQVAPKVTLVAMGRGHWVQSNDYDRGSVYYDGGRTSYEGTLGFWYMVLPGVFLNGKVGYQQVDEDADALIAEDTAYEGFKTSLNVVTWY